MRRSTRSPRGAWAGWFLSMAFLGPASGDLYQRIEVKGNGAELGETPLLVEIQRGIVHEGDHRLQGDAGRPLSANVFRDREKTYLGMVLDRVPADGPALLQLREGSAPAAVPGVELIEHGRRVEVRVGGKPLTTYIPDDGPKPYYFPVIGPTGAAMTRSYPMAKVEGEKFDHPHHRSLWFTHGSVNKVDFWSEAPGHGTIRETSRPTVVSGAAVGLIRTTDDWIGPDGKKVCEDERVVRFHATKVNRVVDFDVTLKATAGPITFGDTKEGMFGVRVATSMDVTGRKGGKIVNAEGLLDKDAWGKPAPWVDYSGPVADRMVGIALFNHPESFRSPTTWHVRDYGLFAANPFGWRDFGQKTSGEFVLPAGESIRFRYRMILHDGDAAPANLPTLFRGYATPPSVVID